MDIKIGYKTLLATLVASVGVATANFVVVVNAEGAGGISYVEESADIGTIVMWGNTNPPEDWLMLDGGSTTGYEELASMYGANLPDLRGDFVRGAGGNAGPVAVRQGDSFKSHNHGATFSGNTLPNHSHTLRRWSGSDEEYGNAGTMAKDHWTTRYTSSVSAGTPTGSVTINSAGSVETRPENVALVYIVKAR